MKINWKTFTSWSIFLAVFGGMSYFVLYRASVQRIVDMAANGSNGIIFYLGLAVSAMTVLFMLFQAILVCFYKPVSCWDSPDEIPGVTVIVPAYNEGSAVAETLRSLLKSNFPKDKLEIIAVNDGSKDDTWSWIKLVAGEAGGVITPVNFEKNQGKKAALYHGFTHAKHEIVVTIDSDSLVEKDTLSNLILPFARPEVGGVAGTVRVSNMHEGFVPRMLDICFVFSCDFMRCAQSAIGAVLCSPGAISGYRKAALLPHLDKWLHQTFLGVPSHIGEDRALTSILLRNDYHVVLQHEAKVITRVPTDYPQLCRTLIRWTRGDVREGLLMIRHFAKKFPPRNWRLAALQFNLIFQLLGLLLPVMALPTLLTVIIAGMQSADVMINYLVVVSWVWATVPAILYAERESPLKALLAFAVGVFNLVALSWICIYSWLTVRNSKWMTREVQKSDPDTICSEPRHIS